MSGAPGFLTMRGDSMSPTIRSGDVVGYYQSSRFSCDALYVVDFGHGRCCMRVQSTFNKRTGGDLALFHDNERHSLTTILTRDEFQAVCRGRVFAICKVVDATLMRAAGVRFEEDDDGSDVIDAPVAYARPVIGREARA